MRNWQEENRGRNADEGVQLIIAFGICNDISIIIIWCNKTRRRLLIYKKEETFFNILPNSQEF